MASYECRGKNKLWSVRFDIIENNTNKTKRLSGYKTKKECQQAYINFITKYNEERKQFTPSDTNNILDKKFDVVFEEYKIYKKDKIKDSSFYDLINNYSLHIKPFFGDLKIKDVTKIKVLEWQETLSKYSYKYKSKLRTTLHTFYKYLYYYYDLDNVVARVEGFIAPKSKSEMSFWTLDEFNQFIKSIDDITWYTFFCMLYYTGCRLGEVLALNISDINFTTHILNISKSITKKKLNKTDATYNITDPKNTSSFRKIMLPKQLIQLLKKYIEAYPDLKTQQFLFGGEKPLPNTTIHRKLTEYCNLANIKRIRIHDFRHSHASLLISQGANIVLVAKRLGHSNTEQTLNTYAHLFPSTEKELIEHFNLLIKINKF